MKYTISTNPALDYEVVGKVKQSTPSEIKAKVLLARKATKGWKNTSIDKRILLIKPLIEIVEKKKEEFATLISKEMGSTLSQSRGDIEWDLGYIKSFFSLAKEALSDTTTLKMGEKNHRVIYEPLGVVAVIVPWNLPFDMFVWGVITNLLVGNTVIFKHAEECALFGKEIEILMSKLHLPEGVFTVVHGDGLVGSQLVNQEIDGIWFTGSTQIGKKLFELSGKKFIHSTLEMGGSNPAIIFEDTSIKEVLPKIYRKRFYNCGQTCDAIKRVIVHESKYSELIDELKKIICQKKIGNPLAFDTDLGPLVSKKQLLLLQDQVDDAIKKGAQCVIGGKQPSDLKGSFFEPTILTNISRNMKVWNEEVFGPVLPIITFKTEDEAIELANDTEYGLGAVIFSRDLERAERVAKQINAGAIEINMGNHWVAETPFGGYKNSGMGREHGVIGLRELCQMKVIAK